MECLAKAWVKKEGTEKSIQQTGSKFVFGDVYKRQGDTSQKLTLMKTSADSLKKSADALNDSSPVSYTHLVL